MYIYKMSFRQFGGLNYAAKHNIVSSNYNTSNNLLVTQNVGQPNSYINFLSDISGNISVYGDFDLSGNLHVGGNVDISGNSNIDGNVDISGNLTANYMFLSSGINYSTLENAVMPKSYIDIVATGIKPVGQVIAMANNPSTPVPIGTSVGVGYIIDGVTLNIGDAVLLNDQGNKINNGVYDFSGNYIFQRSKTILPDTTNAKGAFVSVIGGELYSRTGWVQTYNNTTGLVIVGVDPLEFSEFYNLNFKLGQGLNITKPNNTSFLNVDSSLNFINFLDSTNGVTGASGKLAIGTNSTNIIIGSTEGNPIHVQSQIQAQRGITGPTGSFSYLSVSEEILAPKGITGGTGSFSYLSASQEIFASKGITCGTGSFSYLSASQEIFAPKGITGGTGSFSYLSVSEEILAPRGITGGTGSFSYLSAPRGITGGTGSFSYLSAPRGITGGTGSFSYLSTSQQISAPKGITGATGSFSYLSVSEEIFAPKGITGGTGSFSYLSSSRQISAPLGITGGTGSFSYLSSSQQISAPKGITGATGSFDDLISKSLSVYGVSNFNDLPTYIGSGPAPLPTSNQFITKQYADNTYTTSGNILGSDNLWTGINQFNKSLTGATGSFSYLSASVGITGPTGSFKDLIITNAIKAPMGITGGTGSFKDLLITNAIKAPMGITGGTGSFSYLSASVGLTGATGSFKDLIVTNAIKAPMGITGGTGSFSYLSASVGLTGATGSFNDLIITNAIKAPMGITGGTGSFSYLSASVGITGPTGSFKDLIVTNAIKAPMGITGGTGSFSYLSASVEITGATGSFKDLIVTNAIKAPMGITGATGSFKDLIVTNAIKAPMGITGGTGSFSYLSASVGITGATGSFTNIIASQQIFTPSITYPDGRVQNSAFTGAGISLAGSYTSSNITLDTNGKITSITNGTVSTIPFAPKFTNFAGYANGPTGFIAGTKIQWSGTWGKFDYFILRITVQASYNNLETFGSSTGYLSYSTSSGQMIIRPSYAPSGVWANSSDTAILYTTNGGGNVNNAPYLATLYYTGNINYGTQSGFFLTGTGNMIQLCFAGTGTLKWEYTNLVEYICRSTSGGTVQFINGTGTNNSLPT